MMPRAAARFPYFVRPNPCSVAVDPPRGHTSRDFQLDNDVAVVSIEGEDVDEPPADRELNAGYPFFVVESQARFDQAEVRRQPRVISVMRAEAPGAGLLLVRLRWPSRS